MEDLKEEAEGESAQRQCDIEQLEKEKKELQTENERLKMELAVQVLLVQTLREELDPEPSDEEAGPSETKKQKKAPSDP